jgi:hypothetical protein
MRELEGLDESLDADARAERVFAHFDRIGEDTATPANVVAIPISHSATTNEVNDEDAASATGKHTLARAALALLVAADMGHSKALVALHEMTSNGLGIQTLLADAFADPSRDGQHVVAHFASEWKIPTPRARLAASFNVFGGLEVGSPSGLPVSELVAGLQRATAAASTDKPVLEMEVDDFGDVIEPASGSQEDRGSLRGDVSVDEAMFVVHKHDSFGLALLNQLHVGANCSSSGHMPST